MNSESKDTTLGPYRSAILEHNRAPHRRGLLAAPSCRGEGHNALCGDQLTVELALEAGRITDFAFEADACAIVIATASMLGDALVGAEPAALQQLDSDLRRLLGQAEPAADAAVLQRLGELADLAEMRGLPRRHRCVTLALEATAQALLTR